MTTSAAAGNPTAPPAGAPVGHESAARLHQAFRLAAAELGMASAGWLFVSTAARAGADAAVVELRDILGRTWPVLDAICAGWLEGARPLDTPTPAMYQTLSAALAGAWRVVVVGVESRCLDALCATLSAPVRLGLIRHSDLDPDWNRVLANHRGRIEALDLSNFQTWAGPRSVLLTCTYGTTDGQHFVLPAWLRVAGSDVRLQFRDLIGCNMLAVPLHVYPRWLVTVDSHSFTGLLDLHS